MKQLFVLILILLTNVSATIAPPQSEGYTCTYSLDNGWMSAGGNFVVKEIVGNDQTGLIEIVKKIKEVASVDDERFRVMLAKNENNARALLQNNQRYLIIDVDFLVKVNDRCHNRWAAISIIAHEIGHHISNFQGSAHEKELKADYWSGYILQKLGASQSSACIAMQIIGDNNDSPSHPNKFRRIQSIKHGFANAENE